MATINMGLVQRNAVRRRGTATFNEKYVDHKAIKMINIGKVQFTQTHTRVE
jgi:hypothetical protein